MKKLLTAGIFGTLLTITGTADASIVSRGFFDEAMENYATNTKGKYVLTVDFADGPPIYKWESIDRSDSEITTTE